FTLGTPFSPSSNLIAETFTAFGKFPRKCAVSTVIPVIVPVRRVPPSPSPRGSAPGTAPSPSLGPCLARGSGGGGCLCGRSVGRCRLSPGRRRRRKRGLLLRSRRPGRQGRPGRRGGSGRYLHKGDERHMDTSEEEGSEGEIPPSGIIFSFTCVYA